MNLMNELTICASFAGAIISLLVAVYGKQNTNKLHFINSFNQMYHRTFSLRSEISIITQEEKKCDFYYENDLSLIHISEPTRRS